MLELIIGAVIIVAVGWFIFKGYSATGILLTGGVILLAITALMGKSILPSDVATTGSSGLDIFEYIKFLLTERGGGLGMLIMILCGFSAYMNFIGANDMVVKLASIPLKCVKSPYVLMVAAYFIACLMSLAVSSATGLGVLLMATLFPLMVNMGISRGAAAAICASPAAIILSPTSGDVVVAAAASKMNLLDFAIHTTLPISIIGIIMMAIAHYLWQRYLDNKEEIIHERIDTTDMVVNAPKFYALLPFTPIIGVIIFSGKFFPQINIITLLVICIFITAVIEFFRHRTSKPVFDGLSEVYKGMGNAFVTVVMLLVAAGVFAQGLKTIGFIQNLIDLASAAGNTAIIMMLLLTIITMLAAIFTGSGNAPFYAFVELIPSLAAKMGINPAYLVIPMLQASNLGRTMSPVSGVVVACSGMGNLSPFEVVKRTSVPVIVGLITVIVATELMVPL